uniref:Uncharacterized protein n=1 Tax=Moniliophthora roreri TaxID=221103 RepID=A0A0W0F6Z7_MONRR
MLTSRIEDRNYHELIGSELTIPDVLHLQYIWGHMFELMIVSVSLVGLQG